MEAVLTNVQIPMGPFTVLAIMALLLLKMIDTTALVSDFLVLLFLYTGFFLLLHFPGILFASLS